MFYWPFEDHIEVKGRWSQRGGPKSVGFRSARGGGRLHAACDLKVSKDTPIRAIMDGIIRDYRYFYEGTWALVVQHEHAGMVPFLIRYGEVRGRDDGGIRWNPGAAVRAGEIIARVGQLDSGGSMLHLELYATARWPYPSLSIAHGFKKLPNSTVSPAGLELPFI